MGARGANTAHIFFCAILSGPTGVLRPARRKTRPRGQRPVQEAERKWLRDELVTRTAETDTDEFHLLPDRISQETGSHHIQITCPKCHARACGSPEYVNRRVQCKHCQHVFRARLADATASPPTGAVKLRPRGRRRNSRQSWSRSGASSRPGPPSMPRPASSSRNPKERVGRSPISCTPSRSNSTRLCPRPG